MRYLKFGFSFVIHSFLLCSEIPIVTNHISGRLGNTVLAFIKAQYVAEQNNWPFYLHPCHLLTHLTDQFPLINHALFNEYTKKICLKTPLIPSYSSDVCLAIHCGYPLKSYELDDTFKNRMRKIITPLEIIKPLTLPEHRKCIAAHIRVGTEGKETTRSSQFYTFSDLKKHKPKDVIAVMKAAQKHGAKSGKYSLIDVKYNLMSLPLQYYVDQIQFLYAYLNKQLLHVHIFTDHVRPEKLVKQLKDRLSDIDVTFSFNKSSYKNPNDIWNDFIQMTQFEYLIRSNSTFAMAAEYLGKHKIVISPEKGSWYGHILAVNTIRLLEGKKVTYYPNY